VVLSWAKSCCFYFWGESNAELNFMKKYDTKAVAENQWKTVGWQRWRRMPELILSHLRFSYFEI
jgi:hypothetical protein